MIRWIRELWGRERFNNSPDPISVVKNVSTGETITRRCESCAEMPDDGTCDKCGDSILTTKDSFVTKSAANRMPLKLLPPCPVGVLDSDTQFRCTVCGGIGTVGRCCGRDTREPMNSQARAEIEEEEK